MRSHASKTPLQAPETCKAVPEEGLEPPRSDTAPADFKSAASTNSAIPAFVGLQQLTTTIS